MIIFPITFSEKIRKELIKYCRKLEAFFGVNPGDFTIIEIPSRNEFNKKIGKQTPGWHVGITQGKDILILNYNKFEIESTHKKEEFAQILKHEICHLFVNGLNNNSSRSLEEGLCLNFAEQSREAVIKKDNFDFFFGESNFYNLINRNIFADIQGYQLSYMTVKNLLEMFDRQQIIDLMKITRQDQNWREKIENITKMTLDQFISIMKQGIEVK